MTFCDAKRHLLSCKRWRFGKLDEISMIDVCCDFTVKASGKGQLFILYYYDFLKEYGGVANFSNGCIMQIMMLRLGFMCWCMQTFKYTDKSRRQQIWRRLL